MEEKGNKHPGGRPSEYKPEYCQMLIDHMSKGLSFEAFAGRLSTCKQTLYNWIEQFPEFMDAKNIGIEKSRLFWEELGVDGTTGKLPGFKQGSYALNMKNRFPDEWKERQVIESHNKNEHSFSDTVKKLSDDMSPEIKEKLAKALIDE